ncbi:MAG: 30S ribosome-binding factor RbfA [Acidobacteriota bacterium]
MGDLLRRELNDIIQREVRDPRVHLASVSALEVTPDLSHARVRISVLGDDEDGRAGCIEALQHARGFLRSQLARRVRLRTVPELTFSLDRGYEHSQRIHAILETLHDDADHDS